MADEIRHSSFAIRHRLQRVIEAPAEELVEPLAQHHAQPRLERDRVGRFGELLERAEHLGRGWLYRRVFMEAAFAQESSLLGAPIP